MNFWPRLMTVKITFLSQTKRCANENRSAKKYGKSKAQMSDIKGVFFQTRSSSFLCKYHFFKDPSHVCCFFLRSSLFPLLERSRHGTSSILPVLFAKSHPGIVMLHTQSRDVKSLKVCKVNSEHCASLLMIKYLAYFLGSLIDYARKSLCFFEGP